MKKLIDSIERVKTQWASDRWDPRIRTKQPPRWSVEGKRVLLVYLFGGLGDVALLAPVVRALAEKRPSAIGLLIPPLGVRLFKSIETPGTKIDLFAYDTTKEEKLVAALARKKYDIAVDLTLRDGLDSRLFLDASNAPVRLGWMREKDRLETAHLTFGTPDLRHETTMHWSRYTALPLRTLGVEAPIFETRFSIAKATEKKALLFFEKHRPRILVVPGGRRAERRWDEGRFVEVGAWAQKQGGASIAVLGGPSESKAMRQIARAIAKAGGRAVKAYTGRDLALLVALVAAADVVITNDTGPMHIAFLLERPTIAIFQYMSPLVWGPPRPDRRFVVLKASGKIDADRDVWTRLVIHHLEPFLKVSSPKTERR